MSLNNDVFEELLEEQVKPIRSGVVCISAYFPTENYTKPQLLQRLKPFLNVALRRSKRTKHFKKSRKTFVANVLSRSNQFESIPNSIGIFAKLSSAKVAYFKFIKLPEKVKKQFTIAKTFDIDQLAWARLIPRRAALIHLQKQSALVYTLQGEEFTEVVEINNKYFSDRQPDYKERYSPMRGHNLVHGTGNENTSRSIKHGIARFANEVIDELKNRKALTKNQTLVLVYYSSNFGDDINEFTKRLKNEVTGQSQIVTKNKNLEESADLKTLIEKELETYRTSIQKNRFENAKNAFAYYKEGWTKVAKASRNENIEELFSPRRKRKWDMYLIKILFLPVRLKTQN